MPEQQATNPVEVAQQPQEMSLDDKIAAKFADIAEPLPEPGEAPSQEATDEPDAEGEEGDEPQIDEESEAEPAPSDDFVEIKHNGQVKRLSKEQIRDYASKGFDYETKMMEVKAERARAQEYAQAVKAREALVPHITEGVAEIKSYEMALAPFANVDWVKYSNDDPIAALQARERYNVLVQGYQSAQQKVNAAIEQHSQAEKAMTEVELDAERKALVEKVPAWKTQETYNREWPEILKWVDSRLGEKAFEDIKPFLNHHLLSYFLRSTWKYEKAMEASKSKKQTNVPAMPKPGTPQPRLSKSEAIREGIKQVHQAKDPKRRAALLDDVIAKKFGVG